MPEDCPTSELGSNQRLIVVSNRLPVTIKKGDDGEWQFSMSSGGLVSALGGCKKQMDFTWIGWTGQSRCTHTSRPISSCDLLIQIPKKLFLCFNSRFLITSVTRMMLLI